MGESTELAERVRGVGGSDADLAEALSMIRGQRRFTVDAAYAYARRRDTDAGWRRAADLLELAVAERDRRAYRAPHPWTRVETGVAGFALVALINAGFHYWYAGAVGLLQSGAWLWLLWPLLWWYGVRRNPDALRAVAANPGTIERRLDRVLAAGREMAEDGASPSAIAAEMRRCAGGDGDALEVRIAAVVLARVQRRLAPTLERHRRTLMEAAAEARRTQLQLVAER